MVGRHEANVAVRNQKALSVPGWLDQTLPGWMTMCVELAGEEGNTGKDESVQPVHRELHKLGACNLRNVNIVFLFNASSIQ